MPTVYIWPPQGEDNPYGHVALKTDLYYISFWTAQVLESNESDEIHENQGNQGKRLRRKFIKALGAVGVFKGHRGGLVFCQFLDKEYEGECDPVEYEISATVNNDDINSVYEEFLNYNGINPEDVTLERGEQIFKKYREYFELSAIRQAEGIIEEPRKSLAKTQYSFSAELVSVKDVESLPFYHKQQSCVSFTFNVIQTAWLKHHPDQPIPILFKTPGVLIVPNIRNNKSGDMGEYAYEVPWFQEQVVDKYLMEDVGILLQNPAVSALKISLGILMRPFKVFFFVAFTSSFLCCYFPWLVGLPCNVLFFYRYSCQLDSIFRADLQQIGQLYSIRLNNWMMFYIMLIYFGNLYMILYQMCDVLIALLDNMGIVFTFSMGRLIMAIIVFQEDKLSIIRETARAFSPLIYLLSIWKQSFYMMWTDKIVPFFSSRN